MTTSPTAAQTTTTTYADYTLPPSAKSSTLTTQNKEVQQRIQNMLKAPIRFLTHIKDTNNQVETILVRNIAARVKYEQACANAMLDLNAQDSKQK